MAVSFSPYVTRTKLDVHVNYAGVLLDAYIVLCLIYKNASIFYRQINIL